MKSQHSVSDERAFALSSGPSISSSDAVSSTPLDVSKRPLQEFVVHQLPEEHAGGHL